MKPYYQDNLPTIYHGDCLKGMRELPDKSIDCMVTDPPYGLSFMSKDWDKAVPSVEIWKECLRVLKPGAFAFVMCAPRQDCLGKMICNLSDAGFEMGFTSLYHTYASGFPKAQDVSLTIDKQECRRQLEVKLGRKATKDEMEKAWKGFRTESYKVPIAYPDSNCWSIPNRNSRGNDIGFTTQGMGNRKDMDGKGNIIKTLPATPQAQALDGSYAGFQPKPAVEIILVCMKPLSEKTYVDQALKNQKGITWLDDGRIPCNWATDPTKRGWQGGNSGAATFQDYTRKVDGAKPLPNQSGRFPANLLVSGNILDDGRERTSGQLLTHHRRSGASNLGDTFRIRDRTGEEANFGGDSGTFSRYFSLDQWAQRTFPFLVVPKASGSEKDKGCEELYWEKITIGHLRIERSRWEELGEEEARIYNQTGKHISLRTQGNIHPTAKPLKLMSYLITLGSREGDTVLDPFVGSGTTCLAAKILNRKSIGFEVDEGYCEIASKRCQQDVQTMMITED